MESLLNSNSSFAVEIHERHGLLTKSPFIAYPCLLALGISATMGSAGNFLVIFVILFDKTLHSPDTIFIANLAVSDMYMTLIAVPFSIIAKVEGEDFFNSLPGLCKTIACICTVSCVASLMTIGLMSINRYVYICMHGKYERIFTKWNSITLCLSVYFLGGILIFLNALDIGDHGFDRKSLQCIWDRMASHMYTIVFSVTLFWIPSIVIGVCYLKIYLYVRIQSKRISDQMRARQNTPLRSYHLAKTLFLIYAVFIICWAPYALLIVIDADDNYAHELHVFVTVFAHLHPSLNWLIYFLTNKKFSIAFKNLFRKCVKERSSGITPRGNS